MRRFLTLWIVLLLTIGAGAAIRYGWIVVPAQWSPWAPLDLEATPNFLTRYKLSRLTGDDALCRQVLQHAARRIRSGPGPRDRRELWIQERGAHSSDFRRRGRGISRSPAERLFRWHLWERHELQPAAEKYFGSAWLPSSISAAIPAATSMGAPKRRAAGMPRRKPGMWPASCWRMAGGFVSRAIGKARRLKPRS